MGGQIEIRGATGNGGHGGSMGADFANFGGKRGPGGMGATGGPGGTEQGGQCGSGGGASGGRFNPAGMGGGAPSGIEQISGGKGKEGAGGNKKATQELMAQLKPLLEKLIPLLEKLTKSMGGKGGKDANNANFDPASYGGKEGLKELRDISKDLSEALGGKKRGSGADSAGGKGGSKTEKANKKELDEALTRFKAWLEKYTKEKEESESVNASPAGSDGPGEIAPASAEQNAGGSETDSDSPEDVKQLLTQLTSLIEKLEKLVGGNAGTESTSGRGTGICDQRDPASLAAFREDQPGSVQPLAA